MHDAIVFRALIIGFILGDIVGAAIATWILGARMQSLARRGIISPGPLFPGEKHKNGVDPTPL